MIESRRVTREAQKASYYLTFGNVVRSVAGDKFSIHNLIRFALRELLLQITDVILVFDLHFFHIVGILQNSRRGGAIVHPILQLGERVSLAYIVLAVAYRVYQILNIVAIFAARYFNNCKVD